MFTVDDLCLEYLSQFTLFDEIKKDFPDFKLIAFTISNFKEKESLKDSKEFGEWLKERPWVEIGVHSYDHMYPPDGDRDNQAELIEKARDELKDFLPKEYGYRSPGFQTTSQTVPTLKKLGFSWIAYESKIQYLNKNLTQTGIVNSHLYDTDSIKKIYEILRHSTAR